MYRTVFVTLLCGLLAAQQSSTVPPQTPEPGQQDPRSFAWGVEYVTTPALVFDRDGGYVNGLRPDQFRLFDNGKEQNINVEVVVRADFAGDLCPGELQRGGSASAG